MQICFGQNLKYVITDYYSINYNVITISFGFIKIAKFFIVPLKSHLNCMILNVNDYWIFEKKL